MKKLYKPDCEGSMVEVFVAGEMHGSSRQAMDNILDPNRPIGPSLIEIDLEDPQIIELAREMVRLGKAQAQSERDAYRDLLEARVAGLEALLNAIVRQIPAKVRVDEPALDGNCWKALRYLDGSGHL